MKETTNIGLQKPEGNEYIDVDILNANLDKVDKEFEKVEQPTFDDTGTAEGISSFTDFMEKVKSKMNIFQFYRDFKAGMKYVLHTGRLANNVTTTQEGFALDARMGKVLQDQITAQNKNIANFDGELIVSGNPDDYLKAVRKRLVNAIGSVPFGSEGDNDFLLDVIASHDPNVTYQIAMNGRSNNLKFRRKAGKWSDWCQIVTNSDIIQQEILIDYQSNVNKLYYFDIPETVTKLLSFRVQMVDTSWECTINHCCPRLNNNKLEIDFKADTKQKYMCVATYLK